MRNKPKANASSHVKKAYTTLGSKERMKCYYNYKKNVEL